MTLPPSQQKRGIQNRKIDEISKTRSTTEPESQHPQPPCKPQKQSHSSRNNSPAEFWDKLSRVPLCRRALREFNRRIAHPAVPLQRAKSDVDVRKIKQLQRFARRGGPDLRGIRGYPHQELQQTMAPKRVRSGQTGPYSARNVNTKTTTYSSKDAAFEQALIDDGIYPYNKGPKPDNWGEIQQRLVQPRPSLSPSQFSDRTFEMFQSMNEEAMTEAEVMSLVFPMIAGRNIIPSGYNQIFNNLKPLGDSISNVQPDYHNGSRPAEIRSKVRDSLEEYIVPSSQRHRHALPNFFTEVKGPDGKPSEAKRQIMQDLATGARGMLMIQSYELDELVFDGKAHTFGSIYHSGTGTLQVYTMHPTKSALADNQPEYHATQITAFALTANPDNCRQGIGAWRNLRDLATERRNDFIALANESG